MARFKAFRHLNQDPIPDVLSSRSMLSPILARRLFPGDSLQAKIVRALGEARCICVKEVVESFEVFQAVRKDLRSPCVADLCCGHGLVGILLGAFERCVERVHLFDADEPPNGQRSLAAVTAVVPWVEAKVSRHRGRVATGTADVRPASIVAVHACGRLTDRCLDAAIERRCAVAVLPCCHSKAQCEAPAAIRNTFGHRDAIDIDRTYRLQSEGYRVRWRTIPEAITPMNRVLIAVR